MSLLDKVKEFFRNVTEEELDEIADRINNSNDNKEDVTIIIPNKNKRRRKK